MSASRAERILVEVLVSELARAMGGGRAVKRPTRLAHSRRAGNLRRGPACARRGMRW